MTRSVTELGGAFGAFGAFTPGFGGSTSSGSTRAISSFGSFIRLTTSGRIANVAVSQGENSP